MSDRHQRPDGVTDATVEAVGKVSEALEWVERARGDLYEFHQKLGRADLIMGDAADALEEAGHGDLAAHLRQEAVGRNVLDGRWTFQIVEEFDDGYWSAIRGAEQRVRDQLVEGRRHIFESEMKDDRRTAGRPHHERRPETAHDPATTPLG
ncbi:MAG TPA: hypothetical protein VHK88_13055 [Aquihabitans sp.]|jgi:hypothetical protein|nr:hypothetical protein [Aquihabitans sp.]